MNELTGIDGDKQVISAHALREDLSQGWGLPTSFYSGQHAFDLDIGQIFRKSWQYFCPAERVQGPGDSVVGFAGDIPVVVIRGEDGTLRGFVNMCRHRGYKVAQADQKSCKRLVCRYHAWSYWTDGSLANAPGSKEEENFPKDDLGLKPVSVFEWGPMVLVNADSEASSFLDANPGITEAAEKVGVDFDFSNYDFVRETSHKVQSNWKLWYDNFVECYHCDHIHRSSFAAAYESDPKSMETHYGQTFMANRFEPKTSGTKTTLRANNYRSLNIFPGMLLLQQDELMILSQMRPLGAETTEQTAHYLAPKGTDPERLEQWIDLWEQTFTEDGDAVAIQQKGLRTGALERNRLMPTQEGPVLLINGLILDAYANAEL